MLQTTTNSTLGQASFTESRVDYGTGRSSWDSTNSRWTFGFDNANNLRAYEVQTTGSAGGSTTTTTYRTSYNLADGYLENTQRATVGSQFAETYRTYNVDHELTKVSYSNSTDLPRTRYFANNQAGEVLTVIQTGATNTTENWDRAILHTTYLNPALDPGKAQYFFFINNNQVGAVGLVSQNDFAVPHFEVNATPISEGYPAATPPTVVVQGGDTLRLIAARVFGDASLWYILADENGLKDPDAALTAGTMLRVPNDVVSLSNTADSFKPYNVADALGDTSPTVPPPPAPKGCGVIGMIIIIVVAIVATILTAGVAAGAMGAGFSAIMSTGATAMVGGSIAAAGAIAAGTAAAGAVLSTGAVMAAAAIGAAVGSAVSQGVGIAIGAQDKFDWKQVGMAALSAGIGSGLGAAANAATAVRNGTQAASMLSKVGSAVGRFGSVGNAVAGNVLTQGLAVATGLQSRFSWKDVAMAAITAPVGDAAGRLAGAAAAPLGGKVADFIGDFAGGVASGYVQRALGGKTDSISILADAFGNAVGNSITHAGVPSSEKYAGMGLGERLKESMKGFVGDTFGRRSELTKNPELEDRLATTTTPTQDEQRNAAAEVRNQQVAAETSAAVASSGSGAVSQGMAEPPMEEIVVTGYRKTYAENLYDMQQEARLSMLRTLKSGLDASLRARLDAEGLKNSVEAEMSLGEYALVSVGGLMYNFYNSTKQGLVAIGNGIGSLYDFQQRVLGDVLHGDVKAALGEYKDAFAAAKIDVETLAAGIKNVAQVLADPDAREMLLNYAKDYYNVSSSVSQAQILGALPVELLVAAGTAGASAVVKGSTTVQRIGAAIGRWPTCCAASKLPLKDCRPHTVVVPRSAARSRAPRSPVVVGPSRSVWMRTASSSSPKTGLWTASG